MLSLLVFAFGDRIEVVGHLFATATRAILGLGQGYSRERSQPHPPLAVVPGQMNTHDFEPDFEMVQPASVGLIT
jgi:hypothetical protein